VPAYKLLITAAVKSTTFEGFIGSHEVVRGDPFLLTLEIENIGETEFPGGKVEYCRLAYGSPPSAITTIDVTNECPSLAKGQSTKLIDDEPIFPFQQGLAWTQIMLTPIGEPQVIEYYQRRDDTPIAGVWESPIYVIDREYLRIIDLLTKLLEKGAS
jgi:hypothetical protein